MEKFKEASKEFKRTGTFFSSISDKFKFICNINPNSVPKYDGKIDAEITQLKDRPDIDMKMNFKTRMKKEQKFMKKS